MVDRRALIIDDDSANRSIWELMLTDGGYEVLNAVDLEGGLNMASPAISLYLVDYHLPDGRGTDMITHIKKNYPDSLIIVVSMDDDADVIRELMRAGGNLFIVKPASPIIMNQILSEIASGTLNSRARQLINRHGRRTYAA